MPLSYSTHVWQASGVMLWRGKVNKAESASITIFLLLQQPQEDYMEHLEAHEYEIMTECDGEQHFYFFGDSFSLTRWLEEYSQYYSFTSLLPLALQPRVVIWTMAVGKKSKCASVMRIEF